MEYGSNATEPTPAPTKTGYNFGAWTLNNSDFNFSTPIH
ncbi:InlB B-repeat-containing protein [bacterium]|nr:InlB B-repeat-containing protein [bacterium]